MATLDQRDESTRDADSIRQVLLAPAAADVRVDVVARWRGGDLDRLVNARHAALHEVVGRAVTDVPGWQHVPEVLFSIYGERGVIDILAWHEASRALLVIELKTEIVDPQEIIGTLDRKRRLAPVVVRDRGWSAATVSSWLIVGDSSANRRRAAAHRALFAAALPLDGRSFRPWLAAPNRATAGICFWSNANSGDAGPGLAASRRVRRRSAAGSRPRRRRDCGCELPNEKGPAH